MLIQTVPNEIAHQGTSRYLHLRVYENCTDVAHTNIYDDSKLRDYLVEFMRRC